MKRSAEHLQVIVITGASDGIGAELAVQLAARHRASLALVLAARNEERLQMVARTCKRYGSVCLIVPTNVASESECKHLIRATVQQFGGIDILINNAGRTAQSSFTERRDLGWHQELMRVNYWGSVWCTHAALPYLRESRGKILTIGTHASLTGLAGASAYSASKAALSAFYQCLRDELRGSGVAVLMAYPHHVATHLQEHGFLSTSIQGDALRGSQMMPVSECAARILRGMDKNQSRIMLRRTDRLTHWLYLLAPRLAARLFKPAHQESAHAGHQENSLHPNH